MHICRKINLLFLICSCEFLYFFSSLFSSFSFSSIDVYRTAPCQCVAWALCMCIYLQAMKLYFILDNISLYRQTHIYIESLNKSLCFFHRWLLFWYFPFFIFLCRDGSANAAAVVCHDGECSGLRWRDMTMEISVYSKQAHRKTCMQSRFSHSVSRTNYSIE